MSESKLPDTGERMIPELHAGHLTYAEHLVRYAAAVDLVDAKVVLDIASGSGYGSALLAEKAARVFGFDADQGAVEYATESYGRHNLTFEKADATAIPLGDNSVDVAISFETIEHVADYEKFISELVRVLRPSGTLVVSTPNDLEFTEGNHFHLHEFERSELLRMLSKSFAYIDEYYEATWKYVAIDTLESLRDDSIMRSRPLNLAPMVADKVLYFYFVCSNEPIASKIEPIAAVGEHYSDRALMENHVRVAQQIDELNRSLAAETARADAAVIELQATRATRSYRLAQIISNLGGAFRRRPAN